jgi:hypothetical protein
MEILSNQEIPTTDLWIDLDPLNWIYQLNIISSITNHGSLERIRMHF